MTSLYLVLFQIILTPFRWMPTAGGCAPQPAAGTHGRGLTPTVPAASPQGSTRAFAPANAEPAPGPLARTRRQPRASGSSSPHQVRPWIPTKGVIQTEGTDGNKQVTQERPRRPVQSALEVAGRTVLGPLPSRAVTSKARRRPQTCADSVAKVSATNAREGSRGSS